MDTPLSNASIAQTTPVVKAVSLRWPEAFWEAVSIAATRKRTSLQAIITEAVSEKLGIPIEQPAEEG